MNNNKVKLKQKKKRMMDKKSINLFSLFGSSFYFELRFTISESFWFKEKMKIFRAFDSIAYAIYIVIWEILHLNRTKKKILIFFFYFSSKNLTNWEKFQLNIRQYELYHETDQYIDDLLKDLSTMNIVRVSK